MSLEIEFNKLYIFLTVQKNLKHADLELSEKQVKPMHCIVCPNAMC